MELVKSPCGDIKSHIGVFKKCLFLQCKVKMIFKMLCILKPAFKDEARQCATNKFVPRNSPRSIPCPNSFDPGGCRLDSEQY